MCGSWYLTWYFMADCDICHFTYIAFFDDTTTHCIFIVLCHRCYCCYCCIPFTNDWMCISIRTLMAYEHGHRITSLLNWFIKIPLVYSFKWMNSEKFNLFTHLVEISGSIKSHFRNPVTPEICVLPCTAQNTSRHISFSNCVAMNPCARHNSR